MTAASTPEDPKSAGVPAATKTEGKQTIVLDGDGDVKLLLGREDNARQHI
jgi:hypothetical protein